MHFHIYNTVTTLKCRGKSFCFMRIKHIYRFYTFAITESLANICNIFQNDIFYSKILTSIKRTFHICNGSGNVCYF